METPEDVPLHGLTDHADAEELSLVVIAALAMTASILVGFGTFAALETGYVAVGLSFVAAVALFVGTLTVFEAGRKFGAGTGR